MNNRRNTIIFLFSIHACLALFGYTIFSSAAEQKPVALPVFELALPKDLPNPHSPFWIGPDKVGFVAEREVKGELEGALYRYELATKTVLKLLDRAVSYPTFLPDKQRISFVAVGKAQTLALFTMSPTGREIKEYDLDGAIVFSPSWSPDRGKVVFAGNSYDAEIGIFNFQTGVGEGLGDVGRGRETSGTDAPDWSPNGREIVYVGWDKSSRIVDDGYDPKISRLYVMDLRTRIYRRLTSGSFQDRWPAYSPDGRYIAFVSNRSKVFELWMMNRDGTNLRKLTDMAKRGLQVTGEKPAWSPDQRKISFAVIPSTEKPHTGGFPFGGSRVWILEGLRGSGSAGAQGQSGAQGQA